MDSLHARHMDEPQLDGTTADKGTITLSVSANKGTEARSGMVVVRSGTVRDTVKVSQTAR